MTQSATPAHRDASNGGARVMRQVGGHKQHGLYGTRVFNAYHAMIGRCYRPKNDAFSNYGGRGIKVCDRWRESFLAFVEDMGHPPGGTTLDRYPNSSGDYEPTNCRWATAHQQSRNRRVNVLVSIDGVEMVAADAARTLGITQAAISRRLAEDRDVATGLRPGQIRGVRLFKNKWQARYRGRHLGMFLTQAEAIAARELAISMTKEGSQ